MPDVKPAGQILGIFSFVTIISPNQRVPSLLNIFGDASRAPAFVDYLLHHAHNKCAWRLGNQRPTSGYLTIRRCLNYFSCLFTPEQITLIILRGAGVLRERKGARQVPGSSLISAPLQHFTNGQSGGFSGRLWLRAILVCSAETSDLPSSLQPSGLEGGPVFARTERCLPVSRSTPIMPLVAGAVKRFHCFVLRCQSLCKQKGVHFRPCLLPSVLPVRLGK